MRHKAWLAMAVALLAVTWMPASSAQGREGTVRCESQDGRFSRCPVPWRDAQLVRQESRGACIRGESWGMDRGGLWVDRGCRGVFAAARGGWGDRDDYGRHANADGNRHHDRRGGWQPGRGWDRQIRLQCDSNKKRYQMCQVDVGRRGRVILEQQVSDSACREGYSWGWNRAGVWVAHGCRGRFLIDRRW